MKPSFFLQSADEEQQIKQQRNKEEAIFGEKIDQPRLKVYYKCDRKD